MVSVKCVVVGSRLYAKTDELLHTYMSPVSLIDDELTSMRDDCSRSLAITNSQITMGLFYTRDRAVYDRLRPLSYHQTDVFLLCFSVISPSSFDELKERFVPEIKRHCADVPIILVGTESDLKHHPKQLKDLYLAGEAPVKRKTVDSLIREINAVKYIECSTSTKKGVNMVFEEAAIAALGHLQSRDVKPCSIT